MGSIWGPFLVVAAISLKVVWAGPRCFVFGPTVSWSIVSDGMLSWREYFLHDSLPVGVVAVALMGGTGALLHVSLSVPLCIAGGSGTALVYLLDRTLGTVPEDEWNHPERIAWGRRHWRWVLGEGIFLGMLGVGTLPFLRLETLIGISLLLIPAGLHVFPAGDRRSSLRAMGGLKPIVVAGVWAIGGTMIPLVEADVSIGERAFAVTGYRWLFILPNVLLSDWGDRAGDAAAGLDPWTAWATDWGVRGSASGLLVGAVLVAAWIGWGNGRPFLLAVDALGPLLMLGAVWTVDPHEPADRFLLDAVVAWPGVTALVAWGIG